MCPEHRRIRRVAGHADSLAGMRAAVISVILDVCAVLAFVAIGRHAHHAGDGLTGLAATAGPFLGGLAVGIAAVRAWRQPLGLVPAGLGAWLGAAVAGMIIRILAGQGTAASFWAVTLAFLALFILGWRIVARIVTTRLRAAH
jgi:Protein of unknown function (DUF3054)